MVLLLNTLYKINYYIKLQLALKFYVNMEKREMNFAYILGKVVK